MNLYFKLGNIPGTVNAKTTGIYPYNELTITLDQTKLQNRRTVEVARTFLHEAVHSKIFSELAKAGIVNYEQLTSDNFPGLFDAYVEFKNGNIPEDDIHHQYMAGHYIELIATGLKNLIPEITITPKLIWITIGHWPGEDCADPRLGTICSKK